MEMKKEELKKELEKLKDFKVYVFEGEIYVKAEDFKEIAIENKKLKSDLSECECSMHFENDEVGYRKRECKNLKEKVETLELWLDNKEKLKEEKEIRALNDRDNLIQIEKLREENKKLNIKVASLEGEIKGLNSTIDKLKEENQTLELWLDNKEKLNEEYRKQIDKLRTDNVYEEGLYD